MSRWILVACVVCFAATDVARAQLVTNGDFNNPSGGPSTAWNGTNNNPLAFWTLDASTSSSGVLYGTSFGLPSGAGLTGTQSVQLGSGNTTGSFNTGGIDQLISTIPGQQYTITIYATGRLSTTTSGSLAFGSSLNAMTSLKSGSWSSFTWTEVATSSSTLLDLIGNSGSSKALNQPIVADLSVVLNPIPTVWLGSASTDWGTGTNWNTGFVPNNAGVAVTFGTAGANSAVSIASGSRTVGAVNFVNSVATTISGSSANYLILDNTGGTSASATINVSGSHSISANVQLNSPSAITVTSGTDQLNISGVLVDGSSGARSLSLSGSGTLNLGGANTMSGSVSVNSASTLLLSNNSALQNATMVGGSLTFANGITTPTFGGLAGGGGFALTTTAFQPVALSAGNNGQSTAYSGVLSGNGSLTKIGGGALRLTGANTFSGNTLVSAGTLTLGNANALQNSNLDPSGAGTLNFGGLTAATLGGITNTGTLVLANSAGAAINLSVGNNNQNTTFAGSLQGGGNLTKVGNGTLLLTNSNSYSGTTAISAGTLQFQGPNSLPAGSPITISAGGGVLSIRNDGSGSGGTISVPSNMTLTVGGSTPGATIDVGNISNHTGNIVSFGTLSNGTTANALNSRINFTASNGYLQSFAGLNLAGSTGFSTILNPTTTTVSIRGDVDNQMVTFTGSDYDTLILDGNSTGNTIYGAINNAAFAPGVGNGDTRLVKSNVSQWILAGSNSYFGPTTINGGTLQLGTGLNGQDGTLGNTTVTNNAALVYNYFGSVTAAYSIGGGGSVTKLGPGSVTLNASNSYTGQTNITSGTLALGSAGSIVQSTAINLASGATLDVTQQFGSFHLVSGQTLSGTGNYTVTDVITADSGSTILPGGTSSAGTLNVGSLTLSPGSVLNYDLGLGNGKDLINVTQFSGLTVNGGGINLYQANGTTPFSTPGTYLLMNYGNGNFINGSADNLSVLNATSSDIYTFGATSGSLTVTIVAPSVWTGGAQPNFNWSQNNNWSTGQAPSPSSSQALSFSGTVGLNNTNDISGLTLSGIFFSSSSAFNINGNSIQLGGPITNLSTGTQTIGLNIQLTGGSQTVTATGNKSEVVLNGVISDGGQGLGLNTAGQGTVVLGGANTYTGTTNITSGKLLLTNPSAVQASTVNIGSAFGLNFAAGITSPTLGGLSGAGNLGLSTVTGQGVTLRVGGNGQNTTYGGSLTGNGNLIKQGAGTITITAPATYTGPTLVSGGVLQLGGIIGFGGSGAGWTLNSSNGTLPSVASDVLTLTFNAGGSARSAFFKQQVSVGAFVASFDYTATGGTPADGVALVWQNSSNGANALGATGGGLGYGGITPSAAVEINVYAPSTRGTNYRTNGATGTYLNTSPLNPASGNPILVTLNYDGVSTLTETMSDTFTGSTYTTSYAVGNLSSTVSGALAYLGFTGGDGAATSTQTISNFIYRVSNILPASTALTITNGATVDLNGVNQKVGSLSSTDGLGSQVLLGGGVLTIGGTATTTFDGSISGPGGVTVQAGRLTLTGQSNYSGATSITAGGTLQLTTGANSQDGSIAGTSGVTDNGTLLYNFNDNQTVAYGIAGGGSLRKSGNGTLTLTANNSSYHGAASINGGTLQLGDGTTGDDGSLGASSGVTDNGALVFDLAGTQTAPYSIGGSGSLTMAGTGRLTLSGTNSTYSGGTFIPMGTVVLTNRGAIADGSSLTVGNASLFPAPVVPAPEASADNGAPIASVPEPGSLVLLFSAFGGTAICSRLFRRRRKSVPQVPLAEPGPSIKCI
jgi:autotransporter-associated beta strand protein